MQSYSSSSAPRKPREHPIKIRSTGHFGSHLNDRQDANWHLNRPRRKGNSWGVFVHLQILGQWHLLQRIDTARSNHSGNGDTPPINEPEEDDRREWWSWRWKIGEVTSTSKRQLVDLELVLWALLKKLDSAETEVDKIHIIMGPSVFHRLEAGEDREQSGGVTAMAQLQNSTQQRFASSFPMGRRLFPRARAVEVEPLPAICEVRSREINLSLPVVKG